MLQIKLLKLLYELQPVKVTVLKSSKSIPIIDSPLHKGSQISVPRVIAEALEVQGVVELHEGVVSHQDLAKIKFSHMQQRGSIPKIDDFFYTRVKSSIAKIMAKAKSEGDIDLLKNVEKMREDFKDISSARISAIFRAFQLKGVDIIERSCNLEEKVLVASILSIYNKWAREYLEHSHW